MKPRDPKRTGEKGYIKDPANQTWDEQVGFSVGIKQKDLYENHIIIDIDGQKVIKNTMKDNVDWSQLMNYFLSNYETQLLGFLKRTGGSPDEMENPVS